MRSREAGYSLLEIVVTIGVIAVIAGALVPKLLDTSDMRASAAAHRLVLDIRQAQRLAAVTHEEHGISVTGAGTYRVFVGDPSVARVDPLTHSAEDVDLEAEYGASIEPANGLLTFDVRGRPTTGSTLSFTVGGGAVTVAPETGYASR